MLRSVASRAVRHRLELIIAVCALAALLAVAGSMRSTTKTLSRAESWRHATGSLVALSARSHVWLEERFAGDTSNDPVSDIVRPLLQARDICLALQSGSATVIGEIAPVPAADRSRVNTLCGDLDVLLALTRQRLAHPATSGPGTPSDARFDARFERVQANADALGTALGAAVRQERRRVQELNTGLLVSLVVLFVVMAFMGRRLVGERVLRQRLESVALTDPLTGLANHRQFYERKAAEVDRAQREGSEIALVVLDLDRFTAVNHGRGVRFGDRLLSEVAETLRGGLRPSDLVARLGGGRFGVLLPGSTGAAATATADALRGRIAALRVDGCSVTAAAGIAVFPEDAGGARELLEAADAALAAAKREGPDRTRRHDPGNLGNRSAEQQRAEIVALLNGDAEMSAVFQPLVSLVTGDIAGHEALTRFPGSGRGPDQWFEQARRCGLGPEFEARALTLAFAAPGRPDGTFLSVNVSPSGLLSDAVAAVLLPRRLDGIVIELTENETADAPELAGRLEALRHRGALIAVDDAGAGHAGLRQLMSVRPDIVKLDRALVDGVAADPVRAALIECFVAFSRRTGTEVCAEGIEGTDDLAALAALGVHYGQGWVLARPAPGWGVVLPDGGAALGAVATPAA